MNPVRKVFVVLDPHSQDQSALQRAVFLAREAGVHLHLFVCAYDTAIGIATFLSGKGKRDLIQTVVDGNQAMVDRVAAPLVEEGLSITTEVVWDRHPSEAVIRSLNREDCYLLIKKSAIHTAVHEVMHSHVDWNILRFADCPVLLTKSDEWYEDGCILAGINAAPEDDSHKQLNGLILDAAKALSALLGWEIHLVSAYPAPPSYLPAVAGITQPIKYRKKMSKMVRKRMGKLADSHDISRDNMHLVEGPVDWVIPMVSKEIHAQFVVLGTVARQGVGGLTLGNTAEQILHKLTGDVLVIKVTSAKVPGLDP